MSFFQKFFKKEDAAWDDGTENPEVEVDTMKEHLFYIIMSVYGAVFGFIGCQYCKYLHQRFACSAWGIPLTSRPVKSYSVINIVVDIVAVGVVYFLIGALGMLLKKKKKIAFTDQLRQVNEVSNVALMYGLLFLVVISVIMLFVPFNLFLIGV